MRYAHLALMVGALGLTLACEDDPKDNICLDTFDCIDDTDVPTPTPPPGDPIIQVIDPSGCVTAGAFEFRIETQNWAGAAFLYIFDTSFDPAYDEFHPMEHGAFDPDDPSFDIWEVTLPDETTLANQVSGQNTIFNCDNEAFLTYAIEVTSDAAGANVTDCAVFGHNPTEIINGTWPDGGEQNTTGFQIGNQFSSCIEF